MNYYITIVIVLTLIYLFYIYYYRYSHHNTISFSTCSTCEKYNVHQSHNDQTEAADIMRIVASKNAKLMEHLQSKYVHNGFTPRMDTLKNNRIDIVNNSDIFPWSAESMFATNEILESEYIQERVQQLIKNYNPKEIYEISPLNQSGVTSYTQDKRTLILCLRKKEKNKDGENDLHDINTITFVVIHELSHMMNDLWGHKMNFWVLFKFMLLNAVECKIYTPVDYSKKPLLYCGLLITYNPLYDSLV